MKIIVVFTLCLFALAYAGDELSLSPQFKEKLIAKVQEVGAKCAADEDANGDDIGELMQRKPPTRRQGKCLIACFNEGLGTMGKDGKFSKDGINAALEPFKKENEEIYNKLVKLMDDCMPSVKSSDRCDSAAEMAHCFNVNADKAGLKSDLVI